MIVLKMEKRERSHSMGANFTTLIDRNVCTKTDEWYNFMSLLKNSWQMATSFLYTLRFHQFFPKNYCEELTEFLGYLCANYQAYINKNSGPLFTES